MSTALIIEQSIPKIQEQIEILEKCLYSVNSKDKILAELIETANCKGISLSELGTDLQNLKQLFEKITKLFAKIKVDYSENKLSLLEYVKHGLFIKEAVTTYDYLISDEIIRSLTYSNIRLYKIYLEIKNNVSISQEENIIVESVKHALNALLEASIKKNILSESEIRDLDLGDMTPQLSEDMLIFLSTKHKWQPVYDRLAKS